MNNIIFLQLLEAVKMTISNIPDFDEHTQVSQIKKKNISFGGEGNETFT